MSTQDLKDKIKTTTTKARRKLQDAGTGTVADLTERAGDAAAALKAGAAERAEQARETMADEGARLARGLQDAAVAQPEGTIQRRMLDAVAGGVSDMSDGLRSRSLADLMAEAQGFARRNPAVFVAGAALLGFAAARFVRAGGPGLAPVVRPAALADSPAPAAKGARARPQVERPVTASGPKRTANRRMGTGAPS